MRWTVHGERTIYDSEWMRLSLVDIEIPGGDRFDHHVVHFPRQAAGVVVSDQERGVLLLWRHRFTTDTWGWEIPAGYVEATETPDEAARREVFEETGWRPGPLTRLGQYAPINGASDHAFHIFVAEGATPTGEPLDWSESERIEWVRASEVRERVLGGDVYDGLSITGLLWAMAAGVI